MIRFPFFMATAVILALWVDNVFNQEEAPPKPKPVLEVVDSHGRNVGNVLGFADGEENSPMIALRADGILVVLAIRGDGFGRGLGNVEDAVYFESTDCSGTAFVLGEAGAGQRLLVPFTVLAGHRVYVADGEPMITVGVVAARELRSRFALPGRFVERRPCPTLAEAI
jgi:hypothetical protein